MADQLVAVRVGECQCPGTPHPDGDIVYLRPKLDLRGGFRVKRRLIELNQAALGEETTESEKLAELEIALAEVYLDEGIAAWNLVDEEGQERPLSPEALREHLFSDYSRAEEASNTADDLYRPAVLDPLVQRAVSSLQATQTNGSTPARNGHGPKPRKPSKRSSTSTSPTAGTATISKSPAGG